MSMTKALILHGALMATACGSTNHPGTGAEGVQTHALQPYVVAAQQGFSARLQWMGGAPRVGAATAARVDFLNSQQLGAMKVDKVTVRLWMPAHGHGGNGEPQAGTVAGGPANIVDISTIVPSMSGTWQLILAAEVDGVSDAVTWQFDVP